MEVVVTLEVAKEAQKSVSKALASAMKRHAPKIAAEVSEGESLTVVVQIPNARSEAEAKDKALYWIGKCCKTDSGLTWTGKGIEEVTVNAAA